MRQVRWARWMVGLAIALAVCGARQVRADIRSDEPAAILEWPNVLYFADESVFNTGFLLDTVIQLSNTSTNPVAVHCFYENANAHCSNTGDVCVVASDCCGMTGCGLCVPGWNETDFHINLTPRQPLGWLASDGVSGFDFTPRPPKDVGTFAIDGVHSCGSDGGVPPNCVSSNAGSRIPPVPEEPFNGSLRCIAINDDGTPVDRNVLKGEYTLTIYADDDVLPISGDVISVAKANAIGIQAVQGAVNDDNVLVLGGPEPEYNGCPNVLILNHFFDFAENPVVDDGSTVVTALTLVPCSQDFLRQIPGSNVVQVLVFNEFEQRFSTSFTVRCKGLSLLSNLDTTQNERSIFSVGVAQTLTGQTRLSPVAGGSGMLGVATEIHLPDSNDAPIIPIADVNLHYQGDRATPDRIVLP
jgi:hypothetical protein